MGTEDEVSTSKSNHISRNILILVSRKQKQAVKLVEPEKIEEALNLSNIELIGMWISIMGTAKRSY